MSVKAKFKVIEKTLTEQGERIKMLPVVGGSPENDSFFKWTPYGTLDMGTINPEAASQFEVGKEYYLTFEKAN